MPTFRIPVNIEWDGASGSPGVNVFHGRSDTDEGTDETLGDLAGMLQSFYDGIKGAFPSSLEFSFLGEATGVGDDTGEAYSADPWTVTGTAGSSYLPPALTMLVAWRTAGAGRSARGRTFLGPISGGLTDNDGTPSASTIAAIQAEVDDLISNSTNYFNGALGIYSRTQNIFRDLVSGEVPNYFAVLRSRRD